MLEFWRAVTHLALERDHLASLDEHFSVPEVSAHFGWDDSLRFFIKIDREGRASAFSWGPNGEIPYHLGVFTDPLILMAAMLAEVDRRALTTNHLTTEGNHGYHQDPDDPSERGAATGCRYIRDRVFSGRPY